jgi:Ca2+-binding EF-hand superfamily protein
MKPGISKSTASLAVLLLGGVALPAYGEGMSKSDLSFKDFDANKDGYLSLNEFEAKGKDELAFNAADLNGDKRVDPNEFGRYLARKATDQSKPGAEQSRPPAGY